MENCKNILENCITIAKKHGLIINVTSSKPTVVRVVDNNATYKGWYDAVEKVQSIIHSYCNEVNSLIEDAFMNDETLDYVIIYNIYLSHNGVIIANERYCVLDDIF